MQPQFSPQAPQTPPQSGSGVTPAPASLGTILRSRRAALRLTLDALAERAGCAKSYLSSIENDRRDNPPGEELLTRLEAALGLPRGRLVDAARWQSTPESIRATVRQQAASLMDQRRRTRQLTAMMSERGLDALYQSGELARLIEKIAPQEAGAIAPGRAPDANSVGRMLPVEVPLVNSVAAGYPSEFTDLGYPARVADEYVRTPDICDPDAFAARVVGDSMEPRYSEGDIVVFSPARVVASGMDCFVRLEPDSETTFKRVYFEKDDAGRELIRLQPLNSDYPPRVLAREQVAGLYAAVSVTRAV